MRYIIVAFLMLFWMTTSRAQIFEVGPYLGGSNFIGDVGATDYINPNSLAFGGIAKWNRSLRHSWRVTIIHTKLKADDTHSSDSRRNQRGYYFSNGLTEINAGMEFNFWEWDIYNPYQKVTPYLSTGISAIFTHDLFLNEQNELAVKKNKFGVALPMIIGVKGKLTRELTLAVELGARMTFHDNLDGSNPREYGGKHDYPAFGNKNTKDWYMFTGLTLTYSFGRKPCYDIY